MGSRHLLCSIIGVVIHLWKSPGFSAGSRINVASTGTAIQSTTYLDFGAEKAIDGNCDPRMEHGSCAISAYLPDAWWRLQLPAVYMVSEIELTDRDEFRFRNDGAEIRIGNSLLNNGNDNPRCAIIYENPSSLNQTFQCNGMEGRYINFYHRTRLDHLQLCEVRVYGEPSSPSILIQEMGRNVTLVGKRLSWSDALLYCREFHWDLLSIRGPEDQKMIDRLVPRASFPLTSQLWVGLRRSILRSSWFWMSGDPVDFTQWDKGSYHSSLCGSMSSMEPSTWRPSLCEEHHNFICFTGPTEGVKRVHFYSTTREKATCPNSLTAGENVS